MGIAKWIEPNIISRSLVNDIEEKVNINTARINMLTEVSDDLVKSIDTMNKNITDEICELGEKVDYAECMIQTISHYVTKENIKIHEELECISKKIKRNFLLNFIITGVVGIAICVAMIMSICL